MFPRFSLHICPFSVLTPVIMSHRMRHALLSRPIQKVCSHHSCSFRVVSVFYELISVGNEMEVDLSPIEAILKSHTESLKEWQRQLSVFLIARSQCRHSSMLASFLLSIFIVLFTGGKVHDISESAYFLCSSSFSTSDIFRFVISSLGADAYNRTCMYRRWV